MSDLKEQQLAVMCHCGKGPGTPCWDNGNVHPDRHVTTPGPRIQIWSGWAMIYDSAVSNKTPEEMLAALAGQEVRIKVIGRHADHEVVWSGKMTTEGETHDR